MRTPNHKRWGLPWKITTLGKLGIECVGDVVSRTDFAPETQVLCFGHKTSSPTGSVHVWVRHEDTRPLRIFPFDRPSSLGISNAVRVAVLIDRGIEGEGKQSVWATIGVHEEQVWRYIGTYFLFDNYPFPANN